MKSQTTKGERIEIRVSSNEKSILKRAQELEGDSSLSSFALKILKEKAGAIIEKNDQILASNRDREIFFEALYSDIQPNEALLSAVKNYDVQNHK
ncbi:MAG: DUF1778 domain-containing protein [Psychroflexus sp.]|nr:DUF1778 domain-containing protein [Psychroflexus sp.]